MIFSQDPGAVPVDETYHTGSPDPDLDLVSPSPPLYEEQDPLGRWGEGDRWGQSTMIAMEVRAGASTSAASRAGYKLRSKSDYDIRRASSIVSLRFRPTAAAVRSMTFKGCHLDKFQSIYVVVGCCLTEALLVSMFDTGLYVTNALPRLPTPGGSGVMSVQILIVHQLLTPLLYCYGFAPMKNKIKSVLRIGGGSPVEGT